ncbi:MAG TPA: flagellar FliJ family protein [Pyrinomonadaceae bacterium]|nr:flagellar FliJ family protein [Pyrinomonadaceae bacterium]
MPKKNYHLQSVMNARERAKQEGARIVAARRAQLADAEAELARREGEVLLCRERQAEAGDRMLQEARGGAGASQLVGHRTYLADLRRLEEELAAAVAQQQTVVARCESDLEIALEGLRETSKEFRVIEKHREHWHEEQRRETARREQKLNDELAAILHERRPTE